MKFFYLPGACSLAVHIVLEETGLPYEAHSISKETRKTDEGESYDSLNPKGYVPALILDDGELLTEGPAINQYLADQVPEKKLAPSAGTRERVRLQMWLNYIATELHRSFTPFFAGGSDDWKAAMKARIDKRLAYVNQQLESRDWLLGGDFSVADAYLWVILSWTKHLQMPLAQWPALERFFERGAGRPAVQAALKGEGLV